jgi:hypothetical protein
MSIPSFVGVLYIGSLHLPTESKPAGSYNYKIVQATDFKEFSTIGSNFLISIIKLAGLPISSK